MTELEPDRPGISSQGRRDGRGHGAQTATTRSVAATEPERERERESEALARQSDFYALCRNCLSPASSGDNFTKQCL